MKKLLLVLALLLIPVSVKAQDVPNGIFWDYSNTDLKTYAVTKFQTKIDTLDWVDVGLPNPIPVPPPPEDWTTYRWKFPPLVVGDHVVRVRACTATDLCSDPLSLNFKIEVRKVSNLRLGVVP